MTDYAVNIAYKVDSSGLNKAKGDLKAMEGNLKGATKEASAFKANMVSAGTAIGTAMAAAAVAITAAVKSSINEFDRLSKEAQRVGVEIQSLSTLTPFADLAGVSGPSLSKALKNIAEEAADGGKAFKLMGIEVKDASGNLKSADVLLKESADKFRGYSDGAAKTALAMELFGMRVGPELIPLLNQGGKALEEGQERMRAFGLEVDGVSGRSAEAFNDSLTDLGNLTKGFANDLAKELLPGLANLAALFVESGLEGRSSSQMIAKGIADVIKWVLKVGIYFKAQVQIFATGFAFVVDAVSKVGKAFFNYGEIVSAVSKSASQTLQGDFVGAIRTMTDAQATLVNGVVSLPNQLMGAYDNFKGLTQDIVRDSLAQAAALDSAWTGVGGASEQSTTEAPSTTLPKASKDINEAAKKFAEAAKYLAQVNADIKANTQERAEDSLTRTKVFGSVNKDFGVSINTADVAYEREQAIEQAIEALGAKYMGVQSAIVQNGFLSIRNIIGVSDELTQKIIESGAGLDGVKAKAEEFAGIAEEIGREFDAGKNLEAYRGVETALETINSELEIQKILQNQISDGTLSSQEEINNAMEVTRTVQNSINDAKSKGILLSDDAKAKLAAETKALQESQKLTNKMVQDVADAKELAEGFGESLSSSIVDGLMEGRFEFQNFLNDITKMILDSEIKKLFADLFKGGEGGGSSILDAFKGIMGAWSAFSGGGATASTPTIGPQANGGIFEGNNYFASGGIVNRKTVFGMAGGSTGVMGEAGPEAIIPLSRGPNGKLGISSHGGGGNTQVINLGDTTINVQSTGDSARDDRETAKAIDKMMDQKLQKFMAEQRRSGNSMNPAFGAKY